MAAKSTVNRSDKSEVGSLLTVSGAAMAYDDACTTRERLRNRRKQEVRTKYNETQPIREQNDPARAVVANLYHQQFDVAPSVPEVPLINNLVKGRYYDAHEPVPEIEKKHGLGSRIARSHSPGYQAADSAVPSQAPLPMPVERPATANDNDKQQAKKFSLPPFPQNETRDYWGKAFNAKPKSARANKSSIFDPPEPVTNKKSVSKAYTSSIVLDDGTAAKAKIPASGHPTEEAPPTMVEPGDPQTFAKPCISKLPLANTAAFADDGTPRRRQQQQPTSATPPQEPSQQQHSSRPTSAAASEAKANRMPPPPPHQQKGSKDALSIPLGSEGRKAEVDAMALYSARDMPKMGQLSAQLAAAAAATAGPTGGTTNPQAAGNRRHNNRPIDSRFIY